MDKKIIRELLLQNQNRKQKRTCLDDNELASFVDGKVSAKMRAEILDHLGDCEECYQIYAEIMRTREDLHKKEKRRVQKIMKMVAPLAMAACLALVFLSRTPDTLAPVQLAQAPATFSYVAQTVDGLFEQGVEVENLTSLVSESQTQFGFSGTETREYLPFRLGTLLVDLNFASRQDDAARLQHLLEQMQLVIGDDNEFSSLAEECRRLQQGLSSSETKTVDLDGIAKVLAPLEKDILYRFGVWTEIVRLAISNGQGVILSQEETTKWQQQLLSYNLPPGIAKSLERISTTLSHQEWPDERGRAEVETSLKLIQQLLR
jgi:uncharacterized membrane protein